MSTGTDATPAEVPALIARLEEPNWGARRDVIAALASLGDSALGALCDSLLQQRQNETRIAATVDALVASQGDVERAIAPLTAAENAAVVADVAQILGRRRKQQSVPTLIGLLQHRDDNVAVAAIEALGRAGGRAAVDALVATVERDYFFRTYPAIDVLGRSGDPRAVAPLARLLDKPRYLLEAARALGRTADKSALSPLAELLVSPVDAHVRIACLALAELLEAYRTLYGSAAATSDSLRRQGSDAAVQRIAQALQGAALEERTAMSVVLGVLKRAAATSVLVPLLDAEPAVAQAAAAALKQLGPDSEVELRRALHAGDSARRQILLPLLTQPGHPDEVILALKDPEPAVRALACDALGRLGETSAVPLLFECLSESNPLVVQAAMRAIQSLGSSETQALAIQTARTGAPGARRVALRVLAYFGYPAAVDVFSEAIASSDARLRDIAISGLAFIEHPRARVLLLGAAQHGSAPVRIAAMRGLGQSTPDPDVIAALHGALTDSDAWVRYYACQSLGKLRAQASAPAIAALLSDDAGQVRVAAIEALAQLRSSRAHELLRTAAVSDEPDVRRAALIGLGIMHNAESLPILIAACTDPAAATRVVAMSAASAFTSQQTLTVVADALHDDDEGVRAAALGLLASWPQAEATRILIAAMQDEPARARIAQALATPVHGRIAGLLEALEHADDELAPLLTSVLGRVDPTDQTGALFTALRLPAVAARKAAAAMLAARGTREAREALARQAADDPSDEVRRVCTLLLTQ